MRSSNLKHCSKKKSISGSVVIAIVVAVSIFVIPCGCLIPNVNAVTEKEFRTLDVAVNELKIKKDKEKAQKSIDEKLKVENHKKIIAKNVEKKDKKIVKAKATKQKENKYVENEAKKVSATMPENKSEAVAKNNDYSPEYVSLSDYDRAKLERLVEGEAGGLGYEGCLLVAQTIRDSMNLSDTNSIDKIIKDYSYSGSTHKQPSKAAKDAVSYIFDNNGYAVNHRVLYFYATDMVNSEWHETQNYITTCGNMRFFDKSV